MPVPANILSQIVQPEVFRAVTADRPDVTVDRTDITVDKDN